MIITMSTRRATSSVTKRQQHTTCGKKLPSRKKLKTDDTMATRIVAIVTKHLRAVQNPERAASMAKYMRNQFTFYGVQSPELKGSFKDNILADSPPLGTPEDLRSVLLALWDEPKRECQHIALKFAEKHLDLLVAGETDENCQESVRCLKQLITTKSWWDTVDYISPNLVGFLAKERSTVMNPILEDWIQHDNMWLRRTAIIHQLKYKHDTDQDKLFRFCLLCGHEKEFFIQKSIGWALRNHFRVAPQAVQDLIREHTDKLAKLSKREALRHAKDSMAK